MMSTMEALKLARSTGAAGPVILVQCGKDLPSRAYMALKDDNRIGQIADGPAILGFLVPEALWDEMLLSLED